MKTILRNFFSTLKRFKLASMLNIFGLSIAFAAFMIILMQVSYDYGFDKSYPEQVYRVEIKDSSTHSCWLSRPLCDVFFASSPSVKAGTMSSPFIGKSYISIDKNGTKEGYSEPLLSVYPGEADVFGYQFTEGSDAVFEDHNKVALPESIARKMFGKESAIGKTITIEDGNTPWDETKTTLEIGAVYKDFPANSSQENAIKKKIDPTFQLNEWGNMNFTLFVTLHPNADPVQVAQQMTDGVNRVAQKPEWLGKLNLTLQPIEAVYYDTTVENDFAPKGNKATTNLLLAIALLVIGIAAVNFVNFATSLTPLRIKSINTQKVLGSSVRTLRSALVFEAVGIALIAFSLSILWIFLLEKTFFNDLLSGGISLSVYKNIVFWALGIAVGVGVLAGLYPALYSTSFPPALVLKGSFSLSPKGRQLRTALIGFQFVVSIGLIITALFFQIQNGFMRNLNIGFNKENVAIVSLSKDLAKPEKKSVLVNRLKEHSGIEDVAFSLFRIGSRDTYMTWGRKTSEGEDIYFTCIPVSWNFTKVMGIPIIDGRDFTEADQSSDGMCIMNQAAIKLYQLTLDNQIEGHNGPNVPIVGVAKDFHYASLRKQIEPMCLYQFGKSPWLNLSEAYIKVKGDPFAAVDHIRKVLTELDPVFPAEISFYDNVFNQLYQKERRTTSMITIFSLLAVVLSLVGVFGLVVFETQYRRKEIGLRKVLGATIAEILAMFNRSFVKLVLICFVIATPLAWYGVTRWLETFVYRTPIHWWVFALSLVTVLLITLITVTVQSWRAATANPIDSLKNE